MAYFSTRFLQEAKLHQIHAVSKNAVVLFVGNLDLEGGERFPSIQFYQERIFLLSLVFLSHSRLSEVFPVVKLFGSFEMNEKIEVKIELFIMKKVKSGSSTTIANQQLFTIQPTNSKRKIQAPDLLIFYL